MTNKTPQEPYSYHAFLFPFEWRYRDDKLSTIEEKTDLTRLQLKMEQYRHQWERRASWADPQAVTHYNEANYFYDFVRPAMYDLGREDTMQSHYYYKLPVLGGTEYVIELADGTTYRLEVDDIVISFYNMGVGIAAFHLLNRKEGQSKPDDILKINQFGRRLYPPFLGADYSKIGQQSFFEYSDWQAGLKSVQDRELAASLRLEANSQPWITEDFVDWAIKPQLDREPGLIRQLLPQPLLEEVSLTPVLDDRMFVVCWYGNDDLIKTFQKSKPDQTYKTDDWWYKFVFVDGNDKSCQNAEMTKDLLKKHTNARWANWGTFYGVSRYSLVCLTQSMNTEFFAKVACSHMQTMYYKIALLSLVQRSCVLRFSKEITTISQLSSNDREIGQKVSSLYKQYLRFINKIYFREVTAQEQGVELYDLLQKHMRLEAHTQELEVEVQELHNYVNIIEEERRNDKLDLLTYIGAFLLGPSFIVSFLGVDADLFKGDTDEKWMSISLICILLSLLALGIVRSSGRWRWVFTILTGLLMLFFLFGYINFIYESE